VVRKSVARKGLSVQVRLGVLNKPFKKAEK